MIDPAVRFRFAEFVLDPGRRVLERDGRAVPLQPKVFDTLLVLLRNPDRVVTREHLLDTVWAGRIVTDGVLTRVIRELRKSLGDDARHPRFVAVVPRAGYRFVAPVTVVSGEALAVAPHSLAVHPLRAASPGGQDAWLAEGMADTLVAGLSQLDAFVVRPAGAARGLLEKHGFAVQAARALGVDAFIEGSLQLSGERVRVTLRLVSTDNAHTLWSEAFDGRLGDLFELQDRVCRRVAARLMPSHSPAALRHRATTNPEAYRAYLEGRLFVGRQTPDGIGRAMARFESALDRDPTFAPAWAALGECHELLGTQGERAGKCYADAQRAARRALALDPSLVEARCLLAKIAWQHEFDWTGAEAGFREALQSDRRSPDIHIAYSDFLAHLGRTDEAIVHARLALEVDPVSPWCNALYAQALYLAGRFDEALRQAERTLELEPGYAFAQLFAAFAEFNTGRREAGVSRLEALVSVGRQDFVGALALYCGLGGDRARAEAVLAGIESRGDAVAPVALALAHAGCGRLEEALAGFESCLAQRHWHVLLLHADPTLRFLREHPAAVALLERLGLPGAPRPPAGKPVGA